MTTQTNDRARLEALEAAGFASPAEVAQLAQMRGTNGPAPAAAPSIPARQQYSPTGQPLTIPQDAVFVEVNQDSFESGGQNFVPPPKPDIYPAVCIGYQRPTSPTMQDQLWFQFESRPGVAPYWKGSLICGALTADGNKSGAFKLKSVLESVEAKYQVLPDGRVAFWDFKGKMCQVQWDYIDNKGKRELRIQDVYRSSEVLKPAV